MNNADKGCAIRDAAEIGYARSMLTNGVDQRAVFQAAQPAIQQLDGMGCYIEVPILEAGLRIPSGDTPIPPPDAPNPNIRAVRANVLHDKLSGMRVAYVPEVHTLFYQGGTPELAQSIAALCALGLWPALSLEPHP